MLDRRWGGNDRFRMQFTEKALIADLLVEKSLVVKDWTKCGSIQTFLFSVDKDLPRIELLSILMSSHMGWYLHFWSSLLIWFPHSSHKLWDLWKKIFNFVIFKGCPLQGSSKDWKVRAVREATPENQNWLIKTRKDFDCLQFFQVFKSLWILFRQENVTLSFYWSQSIHFKTTSFFFLVSPDKELSPQDFFLRIFVALYLWQIVLALVPWQFFYHVFVYRRTETVQTIHFSEKIKTVLTGPKKTYHFKRIQMVCVGYHERKIWK